ncbi:metallophosphoesterase [Solibacillus sp. FSL H8-0538]|uniref:metallophosphoesterase n=1 Tax=Solibacillus sp. FSL H8-0538 TaxID=2921400 RepID=UPI0030F77BF5
MEKVFAIGDIHGNFELLEKLLLKWNPCEEQLVFVGDYIDRGPQSLDVLRKVKELTETHAAVALLGNHEQMFLQWLKHPELEANSFFNVGGAATIQSFSIVDLPKHSTDTVIAQMMKERHTDLLSFIENCPFYYSWEGFVFVHAGIDPYVEDFSLSSEEDFLWIRDEFTKFPHMAKETIVFGHTPTIYLNEEASSQIWISPCSKKIGIDGGSLYENGRLNGVVFEKGSNEMIVHGVTAQGISTTVLKIAT